MNNSNQQSIYQIFTGRWEVANVVTHKRQVFLRLAELDFKNLVKAGFSYVYLTGIFDSQGPIIVNQENGKDITNKTFRVPSVFAITNHTALNPDLGDMSEFMALTESIHKTGLKILVDFVPHHTGKAHKWLKNSPSFYKNSNGKVDTAFSGDVAVLNYELDIVRSEMLSVLDWITTLDVDGVRCDMAHLVPEYFWGEAIPKIKRKSKHFQFIAEAYSDSLFNWGPLNSMIMAGFDGVYHELFYRNMVKFYQKTINANDVCNHINYVLEMKNKKYISSLSF